MATHPSAPLLGLAMSYTQGQIREMVRRVLLRTLGPEGVAGGQQPSVRSDDQAPRRPTVTEADVLAAPQGSKMPVPAGAVVTPLARDTARDRSVTLIRDAERPTNVTEATPLHGSSARALLGRTVALGADHGGYTAKEDLKTYLQELGYEVTDCGTHSADSVDYPDVAYQVARLVSDGRVWRGIMIDGAGIGSCMTANKVPGVRAAMCYDHATAVNSREHNDANVLTLGGMLLGGGLTRQIVKVWLETDFGGGRHARRVGKIMAIERRFSTVGQP